MVANNLQSRYRQIRNVSVESLWKAGDIVLVAAGSDKAYACNFIPSAYISSPHSVVYMSGTNMATIRVTGAKSLFLSDEYNN